MNKITTLLSIVCVAIMSILSSCGRTSSPRDIIEAARTAIDTDDYTLAAKTLDDAAAALADSTASPSALSEVAALYMLVNDRLPDSSNDVKAIECYRRAVSINPDSVSALIGSLPPDEAQYLFLLQSLTGSVDGAPVSLDELDLDEAMFFGEQPDSITAAPDTINH